MKRNIKTIVCLVLTFFALTMMILGCTGCKNKGDAVYEITISKETLKLMTNSQPYQLAVSVLDEDGESVETSEGIWTSSDTTVITVSGGLVTPVLAGQATVTYTIGASSKSCLITVEQYYEEEIKISLNKKKYVMPFTANYTIDIVATVMQNGEEIEENLTFTSSDETIATVTQEGVVTILKSGQCNIIVSVSKNGYLVSALVSLTIGDVEEYKESFGRDIFWGPGPEPDPYQDPEEDEPEEEDPVPVPDSSQYDYFGRDIEWA